METSKTCLACGIELVSQQKKWCLACRKFEKECAVCKEVFIFNRNKPTSHCSFFCSTKKPLSEETRRKLRFASSKSPHIITAYALEKSAQLRRGKKLSDEHKGNISAGIMNSDKYWHSIKSDLHRQRLSKPRVPSSAFSLWQMGDKNPNWKGGITPVSSMMSKRRRRQQIAITGSGHSPQEWDELKRKYGYMCLCCKKTEPVIKLSKDHITPLSKGGTDNISNIQPLCKPCNLRKYTKTIDYISSYFEAQSHESI